MTTEGPDGDLSAAALGPDPAAPDPAAPAPRRPTAAWLVILLAVLQILVSQLLAVLPARLVAHPHGGGHVLRSAGPPAVLTGHQRLGLIVMMYVSAALAVLLAVLCARLSGQPWRERLGVLRPAITGKGMLLAIVGTFLVAMAGLELMLALQSLRLLPAIGAYRLVLSAGLLSGPAPERLAMAIGASLGAGLSEELVCRGYLLRGLLARWRPVYAIGLTALVFAAAHGDVAYAVDVMADGVWLGWLAWRTRSVLPGMLCHATLNGSVLLLGSLAFHGRPAPMPSSAAASGLGHMASAVISLVGLAIFASLAGLVVRALSRSEVGAAIAGGPATASDAAGPAA